jgi:uncharacterized membrane protein YeaQ/YmgE (transglycosylase-associated protein family)
MNILYLSALGLVIGSLLFGLEAKNKRGTLMGNLLLGVTGAVVGGIYANLIFGVNFSDFGVGGVLVAIFSALLLLFIGRIIRKSGNENEQLDPRT